MIKTVKFGGSSLASGGQFEKVKKIVTADSERKIVVVSAPGRRSSGDSKVTDLLYICHAHIKYKVSYEDILSQIKERYDEIISYCKLDISLDEDFEKIKKDIKNGANIDYLVSRGEYLCAKLMACYLGFEFFDSKDWLFFDFEGNIDFEKSQKAFSEFAETHEYIVVPGFYGMGANGKIKTFSRGGSDITGSVAAYLIDADSYENWTDVPGILMADPRIVENPKSIGKITFNELRELSYMGAEVLHEDAVFPVRDKNIPLYIKNTNDITADGTLITDLIEDDDIDKASHFITGISGKKHFSIITMGKSKLSEQTGYIRKALAIAEKYDIVPEHIPSSIDSFSLVVSTPVLSGCLHELITEITETLSPDFVKVTNHISLVAVVGRNMASKPGTAGKLFAALGNNGINVRMIEQGADEINIIVGVESKDFEKTINVLYDSFAK